jgi:rubrerythrin
MGDWSDKLDYEQREYYGHFYDPDREEETEEMTTVEILKEMAFTATETQRRALEDAISALSENKGEWIYGEDENGIDGYHCDKCGFFVPWDYTHKFINYIEDYNYCPNCGAKMKGDEE